MSLILYWIPGKRKAPTALDDSLKRQAMKSHQECCSSFY
jgi:hypothetical protein